MIGRPATRSLFHRIFHTSFIDRLVDENKQMDILILRQDKLVSVYHRTIRIPELRMTSSFFSYCVVLGFGFFATLFGYFLSPLIGYKAVGDIFLMGILLLSLFVGKGPILLAATLSALSWDYLFIPPVFNVVIKDPNDSALVLLYFFTALVLGVLNSRIRERDHFLFKREKKIEHLYGVMQEIAKSPNLQYLRINVGAKLKTLFGGVFDVLVKGGDDQLLFDSQLTILSEETDRAAALWAFRNGRVAGWSTDTLPSAKGLYFPIQYSKANLGILVYFSKEQRSLSQDDQNILQTVTEQLGIYLERYVFEVRVQSQNYMRQVEKLHNAIFRSFSKGFFVPLEKIFSVNQKFKEIVHNDEEKKFVEEIDRACNNLKMIVENLLTISQLESGFIQFEKKKESIKMLVEEAMKEVQSLTFDRPINIHFCDEDLFLDFNFKLMKIALKNLLINAIEYSEVNSPVEITIEELETEIKISVLDQGIGIE